MEAPCRSRRQPRPATEVQGAPFRHILAEHCSRYPYANGGCFSPVRLRRRLAHCGSGHQPTKGGKLPRDIPSEKTKSMVIACGDGSVYAVDLAWHSWGSRTSNATGLVAANNCKPYCARGTFHTYPATFVLSDLREVHGTRFYSRLRMSYVGPRPYGGEAPWGEKTFTETLTTSDKAGNNP